MQVGVGDMTKILYHDMTNLYHDNNIYQDIVILVSFKRVFIILKSLLP